MSTPVLNLTPPTTNNAQPGAVVNIAAAINPNVPDAFIQWVAAQGTLGTPQGAQNQAWTLPTAPGTYTIQAKTFWRRFGNYSAAPPPALVGGQVATVERLEFTGNYDYRMNYNHPTFSTPNANDGYNLVVTLDNGDSYYAYVLWTGLAWRAQMRQYVGGVLTVLADFGNIANGEGLTLRVTNGTIEFYTGAGRVYFWTPALGTGFTYYFNPSVNGVTAYPAPEITASTVALTVPTATATVTVPVPAITGVSTIEAGKTTQFSAGGATGGTWSVTAGSIDSQGNFTAPCSAQSVTVSYLVGQAAQTKVIQVTALQPISVQGNFASGYIGGTLQFVHPTPGGTWSANKPGMNASTGLFTPTTAGATIVTYTVNGSCQVQAQVQVYSAMTVTPNQGGNAQLKVQRDSEIDFLVTGGSGQETFTSTCPGTLTPDGKYTAPPFAATCNITVTDRVTGQQLVIPVVVEASPGICITPVIEDLLEQVQPELCCEYQTDCGGAIQLAVPGISVSNFARGKVGGLPAWREGVLVFRSEPFAQLTAIAPGAGAAADIIPGGADGRIDVVVTPSMISSNSISAWGFSAKNIDSLYTSIDYAIGVNASHLVEVWEKGVSKGTFGNASTGMTLSVEISAGQVIYRRSGLALYTSAVPICGDLMVDVSLGATNVTIGGASAAAWSMVSNGNANEVGTISASGRFQAPEAPGLYVIQADVNQSIWRVNVRVTQPTPYISNPLDMWTGAAELWINTAYVPFGESPILALDGSPDRGTSPNAINTGETTGGIKLNVEIEQVTREGDRGVISITPGKEKATITGEMLEVRNTRKLAAFFSPATVRQVRGGTQVGIGGKQCFCEMSCTIVKPAPLGCGVDGRYDTIQLHRVSAFSKGFEMDFSTAGQSKLPFELAVLPDRRRPAGDQLVTVTFAKDCLNQADEGCK